MQYTNTLNSIELFRRYLTAVFVISHHHYHKFYRALFGTAIVTVSKTERQHTQLMPLMVGVSAE